MVMTPGEGTPRGRPAVRGDEGAPVTAGPRKTTPETTPIATPIATPETAKLRLGGRDLGETAIMAVVNRTPDSFFDHGATYDFGAALGAVDDAVAAGAEIVDIGGVKAGTGDDVSVAEELRRVVDLVAAVRAR